MMVELGVDSIIYIVWLVYVGCDWNMVFKDVNFVKGLVMWCWE